MIIQSAHSEEDVREEVSLMIRSDGYYELTLAKVMKLHLNASCVISGGKITEAEIDKANEALGIDDATPETLVAVRRHIDAGLRAISIIVPNETAGEKSQYETYSPEWLTDIMTAAGNAIPGATPEWLLNECPFCLLMHLVAAATRRNGGTTRRPDVEEDIKKALKNG